MVQLNLRHKNSNSKKFCVVVVDVKTEWIFPSAGGEMKSLKREKNAVFMSCVRPQKIPTRNLWVSLMPKFKSVQICHPF